MRCERSEHLVLLGLGHFDEIAAAPKLSRNLVELLGRDAQLAMGLLEAEGCASRSRGRELEGPAGDVADPQGAHEFQARQSAQIVRVPLPKGRVPRLLTNDRIFHERITEMVDDRSDGKCTTEPVVQT